MTLSCGNDDLMILLMQSYLEPTGKGHPKLVLLLLLIVEIIIKIRQKLQSFLGQQNLELLIELASAVPISSRSNTPHKAEDKQISKNLFQSLDVLRSANEDLRINVVKEVAIQVPEETLDEVLVDRRDGLPAVSPNKGNQRIDYSLHQFVELGH